MTEKKIVTIAAIVIGLFAVGWATSSVVKNRMSRSQERNLARDGDFDGAMAQARELMTTLQANNFQYDYSIRELSTLPEQRYDEIKEMRDEVSFCLPTGVKHYEELAFFSVLYVRRNVTVVPGIESVSHPEGRFLVGYKTGEVRWVPITEVRLLKIKEAPEEEFSFVFPGMGAYDPALPKYPGL